MSEYSFDESISSPRTEAVFVGLALLFLVLSARHVLKNGFGFLSITLIVLFVVFLFYSLNYRSLRILVDDEALELRFGVFSRVISWDNVDDAFIDDTSLFRIAGAGIHFTFIKRRYRMYLNFLEFPRVVLRLEIPRGLVREIAFTTRRPAEVLAVIKELVGTAPNRRIP